ncbi:MAG: hypothetical protein AB8G14_13980 [Ilumatobacter sp.]
MGRMAARWWSRPRRALGAIAALVATSTIAVGVSGVPFADSAVAAGTTFTVNSTGDEADWSGSDGRCSIGPAGANDVCTLRAAMEQANNSAGHDRIEFDISGVGPHRIEPAALLPILRDDAGTTIDGYTQPLSSVNTSPAAMNADLRIELRGLGPSGDSAIDGIYLQSSNNVIRGLAIFDFRAHVRLWSGSPTLQANENTIIGNHIGTDAAGTFGAISRNPAGSFPSNGVHIERGSSRNRVGLPGLENRNVISGTAGRGVGLFNPGTQFNVIQNNIIGLTPDGTAPLKNWAHGVDLNYGSSDNEVLDNVISGNDLTGVEISHNALGEPGHGGVGDTAFNLVKGNLIGTDATGALAGGVFENGEFGVYLEGKGSCSASCLPDMNHNEVRENVIVGSAANITISKGAHDNVVADNRLGVLADGVTGSVSATQWGVLISTGAFDNVVENNRIEQVDTGVTIRPDNLYPPNPTQFPTQGNTLRGNSIEFVGPGFGVDLWPVGAITAAPDATVTQHGASVASIESVDTDRAVVTACVDCTVELFETSVAALSHGLGRRSLGVQATAATTATFVFRDDPSDSFVVDRGQFVSALVTDANGSTSEFSLRVEVQAGNVGVGPTTTTTTTTTTTPTTTTTTSTTTTTTPTTTSTTTTTTPTTTSTTTTTTPTTVPATSTTVPAPSTTLIPAVSGPPVPGDGSPAATRTAVRCDVSADC